MKSIAKIVLFAILILYWAEKCCLHKNYDGQNDENDAQYNKSQTHYHVSVYGLWEQLGAESNPSANEKTQCQWDVNDQGD